MGNETAYWRDQALCAHTDPTVWDVEYGRAAQARAICRRCPVLEQCHSFAVRESHRLARSGTYPCVVAGLDDDAFRRLARTHCRACTRPYTPARPRGRDNMCAACAPTK